MGAVSLARPSTLHQNGWTGMASNGKKKTTMAKLNREHRLRERRMEKQAKKDARKREAAVTVDQPVDDIAPVDDAPEAAA
jgi:hypothetical protein